MGWTKKLTKTNPGSTRHANGLWHRIFTGRTALFQSRAGALLGLGISQPVLDRINYEQATILASVMRVAAIVGCATEALLAADFFPHRHEHWLKLLVVLITGLYVNLFWFSFAWLSAAGTKRSANAFMAKIKLRLFILGICWGALITGLMAVADDHKRSLLYAISIGVISTSALITPLSLAFAFWLPVTIGAFVSLLISPQGVDIYALLCLAGYSSLIGFCIFYINGELTKRAANVVQLEENSEVISLLLRDFEESASDWLWETNAEMDLQRVSPRLAQVAQKSPLSLVGKFPDILFGDIAKFDQRASAPLNKMKRFIADRSAFRDLVIPVMISGEERSWSLTGKPIFDKQGAFTGFHGVGSDITNARRSQEQISFLARHDSLTRLPNRVLFNEVLHQSCQRCDQQPVALLCLDLDDFKIVNDTLGHATGDAVLVAVGERIRGSIRDGDTAARLGGDEFAIILPTADLDEIALVARRVIERISRPYHFDGRLVEIGISIGISIAPRDGNTPAGLLKKADLALYRAKAEGRASHCFYDQQMDDRLQERRSLQTELKRALERDELQLEFQPIIDLATGKMVSAESLLRWQHPRLGQLPPASFIPVAEETGLIVPVGQWVLRQACAVAATWPAHIGIAVNLSPLQFKDPSLLSAVDAALAASGLEAARLELEITETTVLESNNQTSDALWQLHRRGVRIALDDFGTGYSSLSYLRRFPFDKIKIDRSFIRDLGSEKDDSPIIIAVIAMARSMNMLVTAEGVETTEQAAFLQSFGCPQAQGFLFCQPLPQAEILPLLDATYPTASFTLPRAAQ